MNPSSFSTLKATQTLLRKRNVLERSGFSLVEVTLALGIVAFSMLTLLGLVPLGLTTFHKAINASVSSQIVQHVVTDFQQSDFSGLSQQNPILYFDDQANELNVATAGSTPPGAIYYVNVVVNTPALMPGGTPSANLASVIIEIVSNPGNQTLTYNSSHSVQQDVVHGIYVSRYSAFIAKNQ
jgi:uncharacterized protein (TIGR02598 family)